MEIEFFFYSFSCHIRFLHTYIFKFNNVFVRPTFLGVLFKAVNWTVVFEKKHFNALGNSLKR